MTVSFFNVEDSTVTLLITDVSNRVRLTGGMTDRFFQPNYDSNNDGTNDSILASFAFEPTEFGGLYGIFLTDGNDDSTFIAAVDDFTSVAGPARHDGNFFDVPYIYLGSAFRDKVNGGGLDTIYGNDGSDILKAGIYGTELIGGSGNDQLNGGSRRDTLVGESGRDTLTGGGGADLFVFDAASLDKRDIVTDFDQAEHDRVDLSAFAAGLHLVDAFTGDGPEVRFNQLDDRTALIFDLNGDGAEDARIAFFGVIDFARADLILPGG